MVRIKIDWSSPNMSGLINPVVCASRHPAAPANPPLIANAPTLVSAVLMPIPLALWSSSRSARSALP